MSGLPCPACGKPVVGVCMGPHEGRRAPVARRPDARSRSYVSELRIMRIGELAESRAVAS